MFQSLAVFEMAHAMATHAGHRQAVVAENVAHADTPGYRARDLPAFADSYHSARAGRKATREGHLFGQSGNALPATVEDRAPATANGNTVSLEAEMLKAVEVDRQHNRALAIYRSSLTILRSSIGRQA